MTAISQELVPARAHEVVAMAPAGAAGALRFDFVSDEIWEETVSGFDGVCQEQLATFSRSRWPALEREAVLFRESGVVVGGCLVMIQRLPLGLGAIAVIKWGPVLARVGTGNDGVRYAAMIGGLVEEYAVKRRMMLSVLPRASTGPGNMEYEHLLERGFRPGAALPFPDRYFVDLQPHADELRRSLEQKWRYHLNRAEKAGLVFEQAAPDRFSEFDALYRAMLGRKRFVDHSAYESVPALMSIKNAALRPALFLVGYEGRTVAGAVVFTAGSEAVYLYGATTDEALALRAGYFLHWNIIGWLKRHTNARWYDLGGTDGFSGLHRFKKGMVGTAGVIAPIPPVANYAAYALPRVLGEAAFAARDLVNRMRRVLEDSRTGGAKRDLGATSGPNAGGR